MRPVVRLESLNDGEEPKAEFKYKCSFCNFSAPARFRIRNHERIHSATQPFCCSVPGCDFRTRYPDGLHQVRHDPTLSSRFKCPMCQKGFPFLYQMDRHVRYHVKEKLYKCSECDYKCVNKTGLTKHAKARHGKATEKIGKTSSTVIEEPENLFIAHQNIKTEDGTTVHKCLFPGCSYQTRFSTNISKHKTRHRPRNAKTMLKCPVPGCSVETKWRSYYTQHLKLHDPDAQKIFQCPLCPKKFGYHGGLRRHTKTHTREKTHKCQYCDYASNESGNLYSHLRKHHSRPLKNPTENDAECLTGSKLKRLQLKQPPDFHFPFGIKNAPVVILHRLVISK